MRFRLLLVLLTAIATIGSAAALDIEASASAAAAVPSAADRIRADVVWLADDARQGRESGTQGYLDAAAYVAARFKGLGLKPGGENGGWYQQVPLRSARRDLAAASMVLTVGGKSQSLKHLDDFLIGRSFRGETIAVEGGVVYAGYGVVDDATGFNDYAGLDVRGKIIAVLSGAPRQFETEVRAHYASNRTKLEAAAARGAIGLVVLQTESSEKRTSWARLIDRPEAVSMTWVGPDGPDAAPIEATATLSVASARKLFAGAPQSYDAIRAVEAEGKGAPKGFALPATLRLSGRTIFENASSPNVAALLEGADKKLKRELVILSAHLDHIGVRAVKPGEDGVNNGALDNASGVATMIEAARTLSAGPRPKRGVLFVAVTAEEKGLLGAEFFARHPTVPGRMAANVNLDMPILLYPFTDVIAFGAERSTLGPVVAEAARSMGVTVSPDPVPEQGLFTRSDHYAFVQQGVPSVFLFTGFANGGKEAFERFIQKDYHRPSDEIDLPIDYAAAVRFAELNARIAAAIAAEKKSPAWKAGDFFGELYAK
jgi:Zn-dependent M28 family amino/carboxypeptidase